MGDLRQTPPQLPRRARLPINRCNYPAAILGGLTYQAHPAPLLLDGVMEHHRRFFATLDTIGDPAERAGHFAAYISSVFQLNHLEEVGLDGWHKRAKADYLRLLRGWLFDSDSREGAVLKSWVESRFGLIPQFHRAPLEPGCVAWNHYLQDRAAGLYNTNALESQLDLVFSYAQYELHRDQPNPRHLTLYRGVERIEPGQRIASASANGESVLLLNNLNSFTRSRERAGEFGSYILEARIPTSKIAYYYRLLPGTWQGEEEFLVIGGLYQLAIATH